jgi:lipopolysaccharide/colanic/teichoic acid biosynthesis glycosyltransferase
MRFINRTRDILIAFWGLIFLSPLLCLIAIAIKRDSPGPVFYRGRRAGRGGGIFQILKFRTMFENPRSYNGVKITAEDDPRITPMGNWLRNTKLNEFPQLWNVLKGEMSLVGPRPEDPDIVAQWPEEIKKEILSIRPGITSPASVLFRDEEGMLNGKKVMEFYLDLIQPSKMRLDQLYVRNRTAWLDLDVLFWTFLVLLPRLGSYKPPERLLFIGPVSKFGLRFINWFILDLITVFSSFGIVGIIWRSISPIHIGWVPAILASFGIAFLFSIIGGFFGVQRIHWSKASAADVFELLLSTIVASIAALVLNMVLKIMPFELIIMASVVAFFGFVFVRYRERLLTGFASRAGMSRRTAKRIREKILIIGCGDSGLFASWILENTRRANKFSVIGFIDDDIYKQNIRVRGIEVLGTRSDISRIVEEYDVGIIIFAIHNIPTSEQNKIMEICKSIPVLIFTFPNIFAEFDFVINSNIKSEQNGSVGSHTSQILNHSDISAQQMDIWLKEIQKEIEGGEIEKGIVRIKELQERLKINNVD